MIPDAARVPTIAHPEAFQRMSAPAITPAPSPAPGAAAAAGAGAHGPHGHNALAGFEVVLAGLFGAQSPADGETAAASGTATGTKAGAKLAAGGKTATDNGKAKTAGDGKTAAADATTATPAATFDPSLAVQITPLPPVLVETATGTGGAADVAAATQQVLVLAADTTAAQTAAGALTQLTTGPVTAKTDTAPSQTQTPSQTATAPDLASAIAADSAAADATATVKTASTPQKADVPAAAPAQPFAPQTPPTPASAVPAVAQAQIQTPGATATATAAVLQATATTDPRVTAPDAAKPVAAKGSRIDLTKTSATAGAPPAATTVSATPGASATLAEALLTVADQAPKSGFEKAAQGQLLDARSDIASPAPSPADPGTSATTTPATLIHAAAVAVRGAPQTVANLAAQIVKKLDGRSSQFNVQLDPIGLGKVDVRIAIGADGRMSAAMSFDTPQAAAELKSRSVELRQAMEQAGFDLSGGMSFDVASDRGQGGQAQNQQPDAGAAFHGRAFQAALDTADAAPPPQLTLRRTALAGVDIRI